MIYDVQPASFWKRISAFLLDFILLSILVVGFAWVFSLVVNYDKYTNQYEEYTKQYETTYGVSFNITEAEYNEYTETEKTNFDNARMAFENDPEVLKTYNLMINLLLIMVVFSVLIAVLLYEFILPLILHDGQTIGKKCFGLCVVKNNSVKLNNISLFARSILGKGTLELLIPVFLVLLTLFGGIGILGPILIAIIFIIQIVLYFTTKNHTIIHDLIAYTVVVDKPSQMIFEDEETLIEYKTKLRAEEVKKKDY